MAQALLRQAVGIFKLRIGATITLAALGGLAIAPGPSTSPGQVAVLGLCVLLASASAGGLNQLFERDLDARMPRTRDRPFVTGTHSLPLRYWPLLLGLLLAGAVLWAGIALNAAVALHVLLGALVYSVVYTLGLKRRTWANIVVGGLAGSFAVLAGAAVADPVPGPRPLLLAGVLFLWTPPHFWSLAIALREQYAAAGIPMLPVVAGNRAAARAILINSLALVAVSLAPVAFGMGWIYLTGALGGGGYFLYRNLQLLWDPRPGPAMASFRASLVQLTVLLLGVFLEGPW